MRRRHSAQKINKNPTAFNSLNSYTFDFESIWNCEGKSLDLQFC